MINTLNELNGPQVNDNNLPIDLTDLLEVFKGYNNLGWLIQRQIECLIENGVEESVMSGKVNIEVLPHIRNFLDSITQRMIGTDMADQCWAVIMMLDDFELKHPELLNGDKN